VDPHLLYGRIIAQQLDTLNPTTYSNRADCNLEWYYLISTKEAFMANERWPVLAPNKKKAPNRGAFAYHRR